MRCVGKNGAIIQSLAREKRGHRKRKSEKWGGTEMRKIVGALMMKYFALLPSKCMPAVNDLSEKECYYRNR